MGLRGRVDGRVGVLGNVLADSVYRQGEVE
jgi:hypothetical protein